MKVLRFLLSACLILVALVTLLVAGLWFYFPPSCDNDLIETILSPDGAKKIVVFQRDCGATTGFSTQASLLFANEALSNNSGNIFIADTDHGVAPSGPSGGPELRVVWRDVDFAEISYHPAVRIFKAEPKVARVQFSYSVVGNLAQQSDLVDQQSSTTQRRSAAEPGR